jgi:hypothetical protein
MSNTFNAAQARQLANHVSNPELSNVLRIIEDKATEGRTVIYLNMPLNCATTHQLTELGFTVEDFSIVEDPRVFAVGPCFRIRW